MLVQVFFNWDGTQDEFEEVKKTVMRVVKSRKTIELVGLYIPSSEWNFTVLYLKKKQ